jgi:MFS family permease
MGGFLLLREPVFGRFWLARVLSYLGSYITVTALTLYVAGISGPVAVSLLMLSMSLPRLLGPFAGTVSDRMDGRRLMAFCDFGEATLVGAVALFLPPLPVLLTLIAATASSTWRGIRWLAPWW